ncbi:hypothetical protein TCCBUS3UF1_2200 [Thermus sp. CCB_US3_UF1]|uniref:hypothetical protein n=1 Tax=Thermus sp. CCB_US3_UF1 TaxID=1111069 RepID=UPI0002389888|nr:hypothetical protein [Thermus sp. CCB_US3_UF1]AEV15269.1 hypothetical protein TCCBUS3UF1_2200 [Thermus sp. CCB_US3_UF1]
MRKGFVLIPLLVLVPSLAWSPAPTLEEAQGVVEGVYSRLPRLPVAWESEAPPWRPWRGECPSSGGSRPVAVRVGGQLEVVEILAERARNEFRRVRAQEVLPQAKRFLPDGHLRVYLTVEGLARLEWREAYTLGALVGDKPRRAYRVTYLDDWQKEEKGYRGTLVFYLDLSEGVDPQGELLLLLMTEAEADCVYALSVPLGRFR